MLQIRRFYDVFGLLSDIECQQLISVPRGWNKNTADRKLWEVATIIEYDR